MKPNRLTIAAAQMKFRSALGENVSWIKQIIHSLAKAGDFLENLPHCQRPDTN